MNLNLPQPGAAGTSNPLHALYTLLVPEFGASFSTIAGEAKTIAQVFLAPGGGMSRRHRKLALEHPLVSFHVRGDWQRAPSPADFDPITLRWGVDNADHIGVWSAPFPQFSDAVAEWGIAAANAGSRFTTIIETAVERAAEWAGVVRRWKRRSASLRFFGPESAQAVQ